MTTYSNRETTFSVIHRRDTSTARESGTVAGARPAGQSTHRFDARCCACRDVVFVLVGLLKAKRDEISPFVSWCCFDCMLIHALRSNVSFMLLLRRFFYFDSFEVPNHVLSAGRMPPMAGNVPYGWWLKRFVRNAAADSPAKTSPNAALLSALDFSVKSK